MGQWGLGEGYKGLPNSSIKRVALATCPSPGVCVIDSLTSYPFPEGSWSGS